MAFHPISGKSYLLPLLVLCASLCAAQTAVPVVLAPVPQLQFFDQSGRPLAFGCVSTFQSQTTTPLATYSDFTGQFQNQNPVLLNAGGSANIWLQSGQAYTLTVKSSGGDRCALGQTLYSVDGVGGGASQLNTVVTPSGGSAAFTVQSQNQLFSLTLTGNVAGSPVSFIGVIAPALVTFQITEDGAGAHTFTWPSNVIGAIPIDTAANHTTSQTFIWNGSTIMPVGLASSSNGGVPGAAFINAGAFTNTQMNDPFTAAINGLNVATEYQAAQGANFSTEGFASGVAVPVGSTVHQADGIAGYVTNSSTSTNAVGVYSQSRCLVNGTSCWGANFVSRDVGGLTTGLTLYGNEIDVNPLNPITAYSGVVGLQMELNTSQVTPGTYPGNGAFFVHSGTTGARWNIGFQTGDDAAATGAQLGAACRTGSCSSQQLVFRSLNSGTGVTSSWNGDSTGNILAVLPSGKSVIVPSWQAQVGVSSDGGGFKHKRFGATCSTGSTIGNTCTTTYSWTTAFADANYTPVCTPVGPTQLGIFSINSFNAAGVTILIDTATAASASYSGVDCVGVHD